MKIPSQLKIGGHTYTVDCSKELQDALGETIHDKNVIHLSSSLCQSQKEATLIHEIFHCINTTIGDKDLGHALLDSLSEQFYQVLKDNHLIT